MVDIIEVVGALSRAHDRHPYERIGQLIFNAVAQKRYGPETGRIKELSPEFPVPTIAPDWIKFNEGFHGTLFNILDRELMEALDEY